MIKVTGCHNQELQQQLSTKNSPTTFDGIPIFQLVKTHHSANKTIDCIWNKKSSETCTVDLYIPPPGLYIQYILFSIIMCYPLKYWDHQHVTTRLLSFPIALREVLTVRGSETIFCWFWFLFYVNGKWLPFHPQTDKHTVRLNQWNYCYTCFYWCLVT
jgi:hypothetical protein